MKLEKGDWTAIAILIPAVSSFVDYLMGPSVTELGLTLKMIFGLTLLMALSMVGMLIDHIDLKLKPRTLTNFINFLFKIPSYRLKGVVYEF